MAFEANKSGAPRPRKRLGFFTRVLDEAAPAERYRLAAEQVAHAERCGFDSAWVAQHHFHEHEGGLPSPFVFLAHAAAQTSRIRLGTGIVTLPLEMPVRVAEDAAVLDALAGGRVELGVGAGGNASAFASFGLDAAERSDIFERNLTALRAALQGGALSGSDTLYPGGRGLADRIWQATFGVAGGARAGAAGDGLLLSRTQPRSKEAPRASLADIQQPIVDAYLAALPPGRAPRILASRTAFVADTSRDATRLAAIGLERAAGRFKAAGVPVPGRTVDELIAAWDVHVGTPDDVLSSLGADGTLSRATDLAFQVHSVDPPHRDILRSIELLAANVAPALGWRRADAEAATRPAERFRAAAALRIA